MDQQLSYLLQMMQAMRRDDTPGGNGYGMSPLAMMETMMPFLPPERQKSMSMMLQFMEIQQHINEYASSAGNGRPPGYPDWRYEMLNALRPHMPEKKQRMLDALVKMLEICEIFDELRMGGDRL